MWKLDQSLRHGLSMLDGIPVEKGKIHELPGAVQDYVCHWTKICRPRAVYICDGSKAEADIAIANLLEQGGMRKLKKCNNCYNVTTDVRDVARVESKTFISTESKHTTSPDLRAGVKNSLAQWMSPAELDEAMADRFPECMAGRTMYVIPFSMGPIGSHLSKIGIQLTDSEYVVLCMRIMTRVSTEIWRILQHHHEFVKCVHSVGCPILHPEQVIGRWPCNPEKTIIAHLPDERTVLSYGSGYGGNSLLGKKCFALRIAGCIAHQEGWLAEHMLIMSITNPQGLEKFIVAAFPSACGKTNMAMMNPSLPGYTVRTIGDDIAWMRFDEHGILRAINPENGFFGVAPGTNYKTNPNAMETCQVNTIFTNVAETASGGFYWEGLEAEVDKNESITSWLGKPFKIGHPENAPAAHPNSRFCTPTGQCPIIHPCWEDPNGVPISAIIFGGRRPEGIPLVYESFSWSHGVLIGASVKSETTAAAEHKGKAIMHDPMAMRPFVGYNFGKYLQHWLDMETVDNRKLPKIFHVNWFLLDDQKRFVWPGFGENVRVLDWICRRIDGEDIAEETPIGFIPSSGSLNCNGLDVDEAKLFKLDKNYLLWDNDETREYLMDQAGDDLPPVLLQRSHEQRTRIAGM